MIFTIKGTPAEIMEQLHDLAEDEGVYLASSPCEACGKMYDRTEPGADNWSSAFICSKCNK